MSNKPDRLRKGEYYPLCQTDRLRAREKPTTMAFWTGERRAPRKGEWFLSGAEIVAYQASQNIGSDYAIAELTPVVQPKLSAREIRLLRGALIDLTAKLKKTKHPVFSEVHRLCQRITGMDNVNDPGNPTPWNTGDAR